MAILFNVYLDFARFLLTLQRNILEMKLFLHIIIYISILLYPLSASSMSEKEDFIIVLDAGHGGKDPGTIGTSRSNREKDIAFNITMEVGRMLRNNHPNIKVVYTRSKDVFVELGRRAEIANDAKADLFVSIHVNSLPKGSRRSVNGVQSYTLSLSTAETNLEVEKRENSVIALEGEAAKKYNYNATPESNIMFELMQDHDMKESVAFAQTVQNEMVRTGGRKDMGVRQANLAVLRLTYMPSVLLEVGFMSNPTEEKFLMSNNGQKKMSNSIYNAIVQYVSSRTGQSQSYQPAIEAAPEEKASPASSTSSSTPKTTYKVQVLAGSVKLKSNDRQFKGLKCEMHKKNGKYIYTHGSAPTRKEAEKIRKSILKKFPEAFIVQFEE